MNSRQQRQRKRRRQQHVEAQNAKRKEALDAAVVTAGLHSDKTIHKEMQESGYILNRFGRFQRKAKPNVKQPRKDKG
jgi:hypothetical protein